MVRPGWPDGQYLTAALTADHRLQGNGRQYGHPKNHFCQLWRQTKVEHSVVFASAVGGTRRDKTKLRCLKDRGDCEGAVTHICCFNVDGTQD